MKDKRGDIVFHVNDNEERIIEIYNMYYADVFRFLICFTGNRNDAEDFTQEVFIRVLHNLTELNRISNLRAWVLSVAKNVAIDHYRKQRWFVYLSEKILRNEKTAEKLPVECIEIDEFKKSVHAAVAKLKPAYRAVVILRGINEFTIKETAEILQCSEAKVKVNYHRALKELRRKLNFDTVEVFINAN